MLHFAANDEDIEMQTDDKLKELRGKSMNILREYRNYCNFLGEEDQEQARLLFNEANAADEALMVIRNFLGGRGNE